MTLVALVALKVGHVLDKAEHAHAHLLSKIHRFADNHADKFLRSRNGDDTVEGHLLEYRKQRVARARRHVNKQIIEIAPVNLIEELGQNARNHGPRHATGMSSWGSSKLVEMISTPSAPMPGFMPF